MASGVVKCIHGGIVFYCVEGKCKYFVNILLKLKIITWNAKHGGDKCEYVFFWCVRYIYAKQREQNFY